MFPTKELQRQWERMQAKAWNPADWHLREGELEAQKITVEVVEHRPEKRRTAQRLIQTLQRPPAS